MNRRGLRAEVGAARVMRRVSGTGLVVAALAITGALGFENAEAIDSTLAPIASIEFTGSSLTISFQ